MWLGLVPPIKNESTTFLMLSSFSSSALELIVLSVSVVYSVLLRGFFFSEADLDASYFSLLRM